jgi:hypothetical protein
MMSKDEARKDFERAAWSDDWFKEVGAEFQIDRRILQATGTLQGQVLRIDGFERLQPMPMYVRVERFNRDGYATVKRVEAPR